MDGLWETLGLLSLCLRGGGGGTPRPWARQQSRQLPLSHFICRQDAASPRDTARGPQRPRGLAANLRGCLPRGCLATASASRRLCLDAVWRSAWCEGYGKTIQTTRWALLLLTEEAERSGEPTARPLRPPSHGKNNEYPHKHHVKLLRRCHQKVTEMFPC